MSSSLEGQLAWVTGGGSGIGLAGAIELARAGCRVVISGRDPAKLEAALDRARQGGVANDAISAMPLDVADKASVQRVAKDIQAAHGPVGILVNSAGINFPKRYWGDTDGETFDKVVAVNLSGATYCTLAVLHGMRALGRGTVINVASFVGWYLSHLTGPAYTATKAGMMALSHSFNIEEGVHGLRATALCPGEVATPILQSRPVPPSADDMARMLQEEDLGRTIRFVAELPPHVCINELVISPVFNRLYLGGKEFARR
ncbi:SDR family oxidoreductase [Variovorax sp. OV329]|uniref:SDR family oxidoreductase n=1 Tax=Variovorax sp. OV329 TaxID=1882825 RepID=UPI0008E83079|nr:SDR family oxidoreductase [Variovorax sp. OV329]SFM42014.1 NADP-dependent 3-hydroxy acid dehydrogenase YdfG [Variovorax sp. OV329]